MGSSPQLPLFGAGSGAPEGADPAGVLREVFGYPAFRPGQARAIDAFLAGRDAVVVLPTGGGKSLCYPVPAILRHRAGLGPTNAGKPPRASRRARWPSCVKPTPRR